MLFLVLSLIACKIETATTVSLLPSKSVNIKKGEPVVFKLSSNQDSASITWAVTPVTNRQITLAGSKAAVVLKAKGQYNISAFFNGLVSNTIVSVRDYIYTGANSNETAPVVSNSLAADQITLRPAVTSDTSSYLFISAITKNSYNCLNNTLAYNLTTETNAFTINYTGVNFPGGTDCTAGKKTSTVFTLLYAPADGTYTFNVILNSNTYNCKFVKSGKNYTYTWPYSSGVLLSPLSINK